MQRQSINCIALISEKRSVFSLLLVYYIRQFITLSFSFPAHTLVVRKRTYLVPRCIVFFRHAKALKVGKTIVCLLVWPAPSELSVGGRQTAIGISDKKRIFCFLSEPELVELLYFVNSRNECCLLIFRSL